MTKKVNLRNDYQLEAALEKIVEKNCKEIPWEGMEINKEGIIDGILDYFDSKEYSILRHTKNSPK